MLAKCVSFICMIPAIQCDTRFVESVNLAGLRRSEVMQEVGKVESWEVEDYRKSFYSFGLRTSNTKRFWNNFIQNNDWRIPLFPAKINSWIFFITVIGSEKWKMKWEKGREISGSSLKFIYNSYLTAGESRQRCWWETLKNPNS